MRSRKYFAIVVLVCLAVATGKRVAFASGCTVSSAGVSFGTYNVFATSNTTMTGTVTLAACGNNTPISVTLDKGIHSSGLPNRGMSNGTDSLSYNLYFDAAHTQVWGDGTNGTIAWSSPPKNSSHTVYGNIPAGSDVGVGAYSDTVTMTVNF